MRQLFWYLNYLLLLALLDIKKWNDSNCLPSLELFGWNINKAKAAKTQSIKLNISSVTKRILISTNQERNVIYLLIGGHDVV